MALLFSLQSEPLVFHQGVGNSTSLTALSRHPYCRILTNPPVEETAQALLDVALIVQTLPQFGWILTLQQSSQTRHVEFLSLVLDTAQGKVLLPQENCLVKELSDCFCMRVPGLIVISF